MQMINKLANTIEKSVILTFVNDENDIEQLNGFEFDRPNVVFASKVLLSSFVIVTYLIKTLIQVKVSLFCSGKLQHKFHNYYRNGISNLNENLLDKCPHPLEGATMIYYKRHS